MRRCEFDGFDWFGVFVVIVAIAFFALIGLSVNSAIDSNKKYMKDCMADGHKEYECVAMNRSSDTFLIIHQ